MQWYAQGSLDSSAPGPMGAKQMSVPQVACTMRHASKQPLTGAWFDWRVHSAREKRPSHPLHEPERREAPACVSWGIEIGLLDGCSDVGPSPSPASPMAAINCMVPRLSPLHAPHHTPLVLDAVAFASRLASGTSSFLTTHRCGADIGHWRWSPCSSYASHSHEQPCSGYQPRLAAAARHDTVKRSMSVERSLRPQVLLHCRCSLLPML
jgi:hypothetical protein